MIVSNFTLLTAVETILRDAPALHGVPIVVSEPVNMLDSFGRWIGIYPGDTEIDAATIGGSWDNEVSFRIIVQMGGKVHGATIEEHMDEFVVDVVNAIVGQRADLVSAGVMDMMQTIRRSPGIREDDEGTARFREDTLTFTGTVRAT